MQNPPPPPIKLVEKDGEVTLSIGGEQAMQAWERDLMWASADMLCEYGRDFYEVGLGLGLSALRIAGNPATRSHTVLELFGEVEDLFRARHPDLPGNLSIERGDFFRCIFELPSESIDGMFFDPALDMDVWTDKELWARTMPEVVRVLRPGGVFIPFFSTKPELRWQYLPHFRSIRVERHPYTAYETTEYTYGTSGDAYIQCFRKD
ncbi:methyltransferase domain-containing protein [Streptomyces sp. NRRL B-1677]|uniref:class I SAM-dependent methyltransferase n=1 Tax=Streptomyces sp. NRRL B-1677 TaxID=2682966 RepID=UPI001892D186|nr:class I SAM-dependent methyltransferase [Streptomyces sp. NRRL B-1677]MBF6048512.1 methyltransferase domain-containing protein [Streptomyces sp. NRRL B-1677]